MPDYIERKAVHQMMVGLQRYAWKSPETRETMPTVSADDVNFGVDQIPAADVAPVRHGTYISTGYDELYCDFGKCSVCGIEDVVKGSKYCPNCGAKMDGGRKP